MPPDASPVVPPRLFHGWIVVGAAFAVMFLGFGGAYSFAAFFTPLQDVFDVSRGRLSLTFSIAGALWFCVGAASGPIADRYGPRGTTLFGMAVAGIGLLVASRAQSLWQVYLGYGVGIGVGIGFAYVPAIGAVQHWFVRRRGFASGIAVSGIGAGTLCAPPAAAALIDVIGWRGAFAVLGGLILVGGAIAAWLLDADPHARGLAPDDDPLEVDEPRPAATGATIAAALRSRPFWAFYGAGVLVSVGLFIPFVHLTPFAEDRGIGHGAAVFLFSLVGIGSTFGRFLVGGTADRVGRRATLCALFVGMGLMMLWWLASSTAWQLAVFALVFGTCYGGWVALEPALIVDYFGRRNASGIIGIAYTSVAIGTFAGPTLAGVAFDLLQSYTVPILVSAAAMFAAVASVALMGPPPAR
jgi:MFS transporter, OFA family, oxalate/formate antiporter